MIGVTICRSRLISFVELWGVDNPQVDASRANAVHARNDQVYDKLESMNNKLLGILIISFRSDNNKRAVCTAGERKK